VGANRRQHKEKICSYMHTTPLQRFKRYVQVDTRIL